MSTPPEWQQPVFIDPNTVKAQPFDQAIPAHEFSPEQVTIVDEEVLTERLTPVNTKKPSLWKKVFTLALSSLLAAAVVSEITRLLSWGFEINSLLGWTLSSIIAVTAISGSVWVWSGLRGLRQLKQTENFHKRAAELKSQHTQGEAAGLLKEIDQFYADNSANAVFKQAIRQVDSAYNDKEIIEYLSKHALQEQDEAARKCVSRYSIQSGLLVAVSPYASFDMLLVGWRNLKMLREITNIYGISPGAMTQLSLLKKVLHNIAFAGVSEITIHASSHILGSSLTASLSAKAGQGVGAGLFTARSGIQAIKLCRPLPVDKDDPIKLQQIYQSILEQIQK